MLKKFLAFFGLTSVELKDGKATVEITEEQMVASGEIIAERDDAVANADKLTAELEEKDKELAEEKNKLELLEAENKTLQDTINVLKEQPAEEAAEVVTESNSVEKKETDPCVVNDKEDFVTNMQNIGKEYL